MFYAEALSSSRGGAVPRPTPLHHIAYLQVNAVLIDLRAAHPNLSKEERNSFLLNDLGISPADVTDVFMVPSTQLLRVGFHAEGPCLAALAKLQVGVPWAAAEGALVYGWSPAHSLSRVRVSGCTPHLDTDRVAAHMAQFGRVVQSARGVDRSFGNVFDGVIHFTIQLHSDITLPHFIDIEDEGGHLAVGSLSSWTSTAAAVSAVATLAMSASSVEPPSRLLAPRRRSGARWCCQQGRPPPPLWSSPSLRRRRRLLLFCRLWAPLPPLGRTPPPLCGGGLPPLRAAVPEWVHVLCGL
jgi:hypothetical protein